ncbi:hypothetical protein UFOVP181_364 [uncultured Caudovirales phage]|uniref:Glycine-rich domain-containing protein n=1 Tax=uncultured Caudovirales phage TaxID=2100421 RepID=A0A6J7WEW2_9CAUD|nr:hypothetical protein UFOVP57_275 [uncultured Caudovirales phage]CAB5209222.1 hypothetical protein UFOVP181_364 [uncultured Caudovirales phage]
MAFDYQTLKNLVSSSFISNTVIGSDIGSQQITTTKFATPTLTANEFAAGAVDLTSATVTGVTPVSKGGTSFSSVGSAYQILATNSANNALNFVPSGIYRMQVFTGNGTWTRAANVRYIHIQIQAGGGGASGHGESGAAGGYAERVLEVMQNGINSVGITIGGGGGGTYYSSAGGDGGTSSFGPYVSAGGGHGANRQNQHNGGVSGTGSGGDLNLYQGSGGGHEQRSSGMGGSTFFGGPAPAGHPQGGHFSHTHQGHSAPGTGGTSGFFSGHRGSDGRPGICVITEYF